MLWFYCINRRGFLLVFVEYYVNVDWKDEELKCYWYKNEVKIKDLVIILN